MSTNELPAGITQEMIDKAKKDFGDNGRVKLVDLMDDAGGFLITVLMVRPSRVIIQEFERYVDADPGKAKEALLNGTLLSHKEQVKAKGNDEMYASAFAAATELMPFEKAVLLDLPVDLSKLPEGITAEMVKEALDEHGPSKVRLAKLPAGEKGETLTVLVTVPGRNAINNYDKWEARQPNKAKQYMIDATLLSHSDEVKGNDWLWYGAANAAAQLKPKGVAVIKNC